MAYEGYGRYSEDEEEDDSEGGEEDDSDGEETGQEETLSGPVVMHLTIPKPKEESHSVSPASNATPESAAAGSGKITSRGSGIGPDLETETKRVSDLRSFWNP